MRGFPLNAQPSWEVLLCACHKNAQVLRLAPDALKCDLAFMIEACSRNGFGLMYASDQLKNNYAAVTAACTQNGEALRFSSARLRSNQRIVLTAVNRDGLALEFASAELKRSRDVVSAAVNQNGKALKFASPTLKDDLDIVVVAAARNYLCAFRLQNSHDQLVPYASPRLQLKFCSTSIVSYVVSKWAARSSFIGIILCAMSFDRVLHSQTACLLPLLNIFEYKVLIAGYAAIPFGTELASLRQATKHLREAGISF